MAIADPVSRPARLTAVDVPRSAALLEMMAMHALVACGDEASHDGDARRRQPLRRRSSLVADVSLAFMSCGRRDAQGRDRTGAGASLVVRAPLIGVIGLALGMLEQESGVEGILPFYDVLFLLAIPLLGLPLLALAGRAHRLAAAWAKVLGVGQDQIGRLDHFFDRGARRWRRCDSRSPWQLLAEHVDLHELTDGGHYFLRTRPTAAAHAVLHAADLLTSS